MGISWYCVGYRSILPGDCHALRARNDKSEACCVKPISFLRLMRQPLVRQKGLLHLNLRVLIIKKNGYPKVSVLVRQKGLVCVFAREWAKTEVSCPSSRA